MDGGKDIIAIQDGIETIKYLIECKRYAEGRRIGIDVVQRLHGVVSAEGATKRMIVTSSKFTNAAVQYLERNKYLFEGIDFERLMSWIHEYQKREQGDLL